MRKYELSNTANLYHVSKVQHDGEIFKPRVPKFKLYAEDNKIKRICVSTSVVGALRAITCEDVPGVYRIHKPVNVGKKKISDYLYKPTKDEVPDVIETREKWILCPVRMVDIGYVVVSFSGCPNFTSTCVSVSGYK